MAKTLRIRCESELLPLKAIRLIEKEKGARYVCETCIQDKNGNWANQPAAIFMCPEPHPVSGSKYFAVIGRPNILGDKMEFFFTNGQSAVDHPIAGVIAKNGDVIYSRYRHDYRTSEDGSVNIDGGRDYTKRTCVDTSVDKDWGQSVTLQIVEDKLLIVSDVLC